jgi:hypothetical protein
VDQALWKRVKEAAVVGFELVCIGGRIFLREREVGTGNMFEGAKETGWAASWARSEGLRSRSLSLFGSYDPSPGMALLVLCTWQFFCFHKNAGSSANIRTLEIGS